MWAATVQVLGICVNEQGVPTSGVITINNVGFGSFPRAKYSPYIHGSGGFLVVWPEEIGPGITQLQSRTVSCTGQMGPEQVVSGPNSAWLESGAALAYSPASRRFLVAWKTYIPDVKATLINEAGTQFGPIVDISSGFGRDPGVTWNPYHDHFGVSYSGETGPNGSVGHSGFVLMPAANPSHFGRVVFNFVPGGLVTITDLDFSTATGRYVMTWFELAGGAYTRIAEIGAAGNIVASGVASARLGNYDALSIAFSPVTGTFALVGLGPGDNVLGVELNSRGFPFNGENTVAAVLPTRPARYTRVSSSAGEPSWNSTFSMGFGSVSSVIARSFAVSGGPAGSFDAPPAPPPPPPPGPAPAPPPPSGGCAGASPVPGWVCVSGNWLPPDHPLAGVAQPPAPPPAPAPAPDHRRLPRAALEERRFQVGFAWAGTGCRPIIRWLPALPRQHPRLLPRRHLRRTRARRFSPDRTGRASTGTGCRFRWCARRCSLAPTGAA